MVNIIVPTYKARKTLPNLLDSLVAQTEKKFFVTLVQDCDGENYLDIIEEYERRGLHISLLSTKVNSGPGIARQVGIDASNMFDYLMFIDSDDIVYPRAVELLYKTAKIEKADIVVSDFSREDNPDFKKNLIKNKIYGTWLHGKIFRTSFLKENNIYFPVGLRTNEDVFFNMLAMNLSKNTVHIKDEVYLWRKNKDSITSNIDNKKIFKYDFIKAIVSSLVILKEKIKNKDLIRQLIVYNLIKIYNTLYSEYIDFSLLQSHIKDIKYICDDISIQDIARGKNFIDIGEVKDKNTFIFFKNNIEVWFNDLKEKINA